MALFQRKTFQLLEFVYGYTNVVQRECDGLIKYITNYLEMNMFVPTYVVCV